MEKYAGKEKTEDSPDTHTNMATGRVSHSVLTE